MCVMMCRALWAVPCAVMCCVQVTNTPWGERVSFVFNPAGDTSPKALHVSPFMDMDNTWWALGQGLCTHRGCSGCSAGSSKDGLSCSAGTAARVTGVHVMPACASGLLLCVPATPLKAVHWYASSSWGCHQPGVGTSARTAATSVVYTGRKLEHQSHPVHSPQDAVFLSVQLQLAQPSWFLPNSWPCTTGVLQAANRQ